MQRYRKVIAALMLVLGCVAILVAVANLYNIDPQPWWFIASYGVLGVVLIGFGTRLWRRSLSS